MSSKSIRLGAALIAVALTAAFGVQSYYLYRLHARLEEVAAEGRLQRRAEASEVAPGGAVRSGRASPRVPPLDARDWDPLREMEAMRARVDELFADSLGRFEPPTAFLDEGLPRADLSEGDGEYVVRMDVPGTDRTNLEVTLEDGSLRVRGDRSEQVEEDGPGGLVRQERRSGSFERWLALPGPVDPGSLTSDYSDGVLTIRVRKT